MTTYITKIIQNGQLMKLAALDEKVDKHGDVFHFEDDGIYLVKDHDVYPVSHPDLSTQPSVLPQRYGNLAIKEVLIANGREDEIPSDAMIMSAFSFNKEACVPAVCKKVNEKWTITNSESIVPMFTLILYTGADRSYYYDAYTHPKKHYGVSLAETTHLPKNIETTKEIDFMFSGDATIDNLVGLYISAGDEYHYSPSYDNIIGMNAGARIYVGPYESYYVNLDEDVQYVGAGNYRFSISGGIQLPYLYGLLFVFADGTRVEIGNYYTSSSSSLS